MDGNRLQGEIVVCGVPFEKGEEEAKKALAKLKADGVRRYRFTATGINLSRRQEVSFLLVITMIWCGLSRKQDLNLFHSF